MRVERGGGFSSYGKKNFPRDPWNILFSYLSVSRLQADADCVLCDPVTTLFCGLDFRCCASSWKCMPYCFPELGVLKNVLLVATFVPSTQLRN